MALLHKRIWKMYDVSKTIFLLTFSTCIWTGKKMEPNYSFCKLQCLLYRSTSSILEPNLEGKMVSDDF